MKKAELILAFFLLSTVIFGQTQLLKDYDFDKGGFTLLGSLTDAETDPNGLADSLGEFYTDDIAVLNSFKKEWIFKTPSPKYACGYHYAVYLCKGGLAIESFRINLNCNEIATEKGYFYFDSNKLRMFKGKLKKPFTKYDNFYSFSDARSARTKILSETNLIMTYTPDWTKYEGEFSFVYTCPKGSGDCLDKEKKLLLQLTGEMKKTFPNEIFELEGGGGSNTDLDVNVKCNKTLADNFKLYPLGWKKWGPYQLGLTSYWIKK